MDPISYRDGMAENNNNSSGNDSIMQAGVGNPLSCSNDPDKFVRNFPPGYLFVPTDTELVQEYLLKKVMNWPHIPLNRIHEENIYNYNPDQLASQYKQIRESGWYFFTSLKRKYSNGSRPNRSAGSGYWRATGSETKICNNRKLIGLRRNLDFYEGKHPEGVRTDWKMHEYKLSGIYASQSGSNPGKTDKKQLDTVLCKIYRNRRREDKLENQGHVGTITYDPDVVMQSEAGAPPVANQVIDLTFLRHDFSWSDVWNNSAYNGSSMINCHLPGYGEQCFDQSCNQVDAVNMESHMHSHGSWLHSMGSVRSGHQVGGDNIESPMPSDMQRAPEPAFLLPRVPRGTDMGSLDY